MSRDVKFVFFEFELCKIRILFELCLGSESGRGRPPWVSNGTQWFADWVAQPFLEYFIALASTTMYYLLCALPIIATWQQWTNFNLRFEYWTYAIQIRILKLKFENSNVVDRP